MNRGLTMFTIDKMIEKVEEIEKVYLEDIYKQLDKPLKKLDLFLQEEIKKKCVEKDLVMSNSVYPELLPFTIINRVKTPISLREKLIRTEKFFEVHADNRERIKENILNSIDDLVGFTILLDTSLYLEDLYLCVKDLVNESPSLDIIEDGKKYIGQLEYYNLKLICCRNKETFNFEVQIKSSMVSAFTNLEHKLMYKNNKVMISKTNSQNMINSVTPAIIAAENVLDTAIMSIKTNEEQREDFERKDKIEKLLQFNNDNKTMFSSYIDRLDEIIDKASKGFVTYNNSEIEEFWTKYKKDNSILEIKDNNILISLLQNILDINEEFLENILFYEYKDSNLKKLFNEHMKLFREVLKRDEELKNSIYKESSRLKDTIQYSVDFAHECIAGIKEFYEEDEEHINIIEQKLFTLYFEFLHTKRVKIDKKEIEDIIDDTQLEDYKLDIIAIVMQVLSEKSESEEEL